LAGLTLVAARGQATVTAVMTDNGSCYRSGAFAAALGEIQHVWTRPYRPQTNGKVERFNRTPAEEWAYAATYLSDEARAATYLSWLHYCNHHRPHTGIGGQRPSDWAAAGFSDSSFG
jgi:transposase InsO family protein